MEKNEIEEENKSIKNKEANKYLDKVYKFITKENRELIGNLKAFHKEGNFYLTDCVEVFNKKSDNYTTNDLFENCEEHQFYYETENYQYQYINNCIFPVEEIADILTLKDDIFNNYKKMLEDYAKKRLVEDLKKQKEEELLKEQNEIKEDNKEDKEDKKDINDEILENIKKEGKKKKRRKKKK